MTTRWVIFTVIWIGLCLLLALGCGLDGGALGVKQIAGPQGEQGDTGPQGEDGIPGIDGQDGLDGSSCSTFQVPGGAVIQCTDGTYSMVSDGQPGSSIEILNPCGDLDRQDEVFLKFTDSDGTLTVVAFFTDNGSALFSRLSVLKCDGQTEYITTDGASCIFKLNTDCDLIDEEAK